jgi:D-lactate dehydrogenase (cytochrome)
MPNDRKPLFDVLTQLLGARLQLGDDIRREHAKDVSHHAAQLPDAVTFPECNEEVAAIVRCCNEHRCPVIPFGTGTAVEGGVVAIHGGVSVDLSRMNRILRVSPDDRDVTVEAGVTRHQLNRHLRDTATNLYFPVDPGADASLGGMAATCASGSAAVRYGTMRDNVLGLTVVLADGRIIHPGSRARKSSAGYDLTRLFIGSEGTLGIITEVTLRLTHRPAAVSAAVCDFPDIQSAVDAVIEVISAGIPMARIELLDDVQMGAVNRYSKLNYRVAPTLFFEFHGSPTGVVEQAEAVGVIVGQHGGGEFQWATAEEDRDRLWQARHDAYYAALALREGGVGYVTDVCVPVSQLAHCINRAKEHLRATKIPAPLFGHVGDGNFHVVFSIDPDSPEELAEVEQLSRKLIADALEAGGTCTGEHGIGIGKLRELEQEQGEAIHVMRAIKTALDPLNIMNPGKVLQM